MKLTKEEKELILKEREKAEADKPIKIGYLKEDLYVAWQQSYYIKKWTLSLQEKNDIIKDFSSKIELGLKAGSECLCFLNEDGEEEWYDEINNVIEGMPSTWAEKHLRDIKDLKPKKRK